MKKKVIKSILIIVCFFTTTISNGQVKVNENNIILENNSIKAVFCKTSGSLKQLNYKDTGWKIQKRSYLSKSFRMLVPTSNRKDNTVWGMQQNLETYEISPLQDEITFVWKDLTSTEIKGLDITFRGTVKLTENNLEYSGEVINNSNYTIDAIYWPYLGDFSVPKDKNKLEWLKFGYAGGLQRIPIYPEFASFQGYYGVDYPIQVYDSQYSQYASFGIVQDKTQGLYIGYHDTTDNHLVSFNLELKPGYEYAYSMNYGTVPKADSISGEPVRMELSCSHIAYVNSNETMKLEKIVLSPYQGDWHTGADQYKKWRKTWAKKIISPEWVNDVHSWQQIQIKSSEDRPQFKYNELTNYAKDCAKHGVKAIQLTGWTIGGQDRGNPSHDTDPLLGTYDELKKAIGECEELGVKIVLFNKYTWADESQKWFKDELIKYSTKDPYGNYHKYSGYEYQTITQLNNINTRRLIPMCQVSEEWREIAAKEFEKSIDLGAAGMLYDENQHHGGAIFCFDKTHGHHIPANIYSGDYFLESKFKKIRDKKNPEYILVGESCRDLQLRNYNISYFRIEGNYTPIHRYIAPEANMMIAVIGHNDRNTINQALMYRFIISYEPRNFKGRLDEYPQTIEYGEKVDNLRKKYKDYLWNAEFKDVIGAEVTLPKGENYKHYTVFSNIKENKRAIVITNPSINNSVEVKAKFDTPAKNLAYATPENQDLRQFKGSIVIPPLSAVVVIEE